MVHNMHVHSPSFTDSIWDSSWGPVYNYIDVLSVFLSICLSLQRILTKYKTNCHERVRQRKLTEGIIQ